MERVKACVSACDGIPTASLKAGIVAELVAVVEMALADSVNEDTLNAARAVLAKLKGTP